MLSFGRPSRYLSFFVLASLCLSVAACTVVHRKPEGPLYESCRPLCGDARACRIRGEHTLAAEKLLDCRNRTLEIESGARVVVENGFLVLRAGEIELEPRSELVARRTTPEKPAGVILAVQGAFESRGRIRTEGPGRGGSVDISADGPLRIAGAGIDVSARSPGASAGTITLRSEKDIRLEGPLSADAVLSEGEADGGTVEVEAGGKLLVAAPIGASGRGGTGGSIVLHAWRELGIEAPVRADGHGEASQGGEVELAAPRIRVRSRIRALGGIGASEKSGRGGLLVLEAPARQDEPEYRPRVEIEGELEARAAEALPGGDGGGISIRTPGDVRIGRGGTLRTDARGPESSGGDITLESGGRVRLEERASFDARGSRQGAAIEVSGCSVVLERNTVLRAHAKEKGGAISLAARELRIGPSCVFDATGEDDGTITLTHAGPFEIAESARFRPEPEIEEDEMLEACESED